MFNRERRKLTVTVRVVEVPEIPVRWSLLIGDAAQKTRTALDYLAYELVALCPLLEFVSFLSDELGLEGTAGNRAPLKEAAGIASARCARRAERLVFRPATVLGEYIAQERDRDVPASERVCACFGVDRCGAENADRFPGASVVPVHLGEALSKLADAGHAPWRSPSGFAPAVSSMRS